MIRTSLIFILLVCFNYLNAQNIQIENDSHRSIRPGYYKWKVYVVADQTTLASIKSVEYTLHPTFINPIITVPASDKNKNFSYSASGWGEFDIKVKIDFW